MCADEAAEAGLEKLFPVRKTRLLFRLTPAAPGGLSRASRREAIVAADSEQEARIIAHLHDPHGNDWGSQAFASCVPIECIGVHSHGDISFLSTPVPPPRGTEQPTRRR